MLAPNGSSEKEEKEKDGVNTAHWIKHGKENGSFLLDMLSCFTALRFHKLGN